MKEAKTRFYETVYAKPARLAVDRPTFSFSFDDVPASAYHLGAPILNDHGAKGTFYIAGELADPETQQEEGDFISLAQAAELSAAGHHIGCHTFSHYVLDRGTATGLAADSAKNRGVLRDAIGCEALDFSYPMGLVSVNAKRLLRAEYETLRSNRPGINRGRIDLAFLRAERLYSQTFDREQIQALIDDCVSHGGWLVFYTHGVCEDVGPYDVTEADLRWVLERCRATRAQILNVREAASHVVL